MLDVHPAKLELLRSPQVIETKHRVRKPGIIHMFAALWKLAATRKLTVYNLFMKANLGAFDKNGELADYSRLHFSMGSLPLPQQLTAVKTVDDPVKVAISWNPELQTKAESADDELLCVWASPNHRIGPDATGSLRHDGQCILALPATEEAWNLYLFFRNSSGNSYSDDKHVAL